MKNWELASVDNGVQIREANPMGEEMMLLANITFSEHILICFPTCLQQQ